ncbi:hypothetical protein Tco_0863699 [Tanacetum coccineum]
MSIRLCRSTTLLGEGPEGAECAIISEIGVNPVLTSGRTRIPPLDRDQLRHQLLSLAKTYNNNKASYSSQALECRPHHQDLRCGGDQAGTSPENYSG